MPIGFPMRLNILGRKTSRKAPGSTRYFCQCDFVLGAAVRGSCWDPLTDMNNQRDNTNINIDGPILL